MITTLPRQRSRTPLGPACSNCLAKALYDNAAEAPDELSFRKGDILTVLEQNTAGLEGWWLCSIKGRQGIAPGNRLRLLPGMYDNSQHQGSRRSWHTNPYKVTLQQKDGSKEKLTNSWCQVLTPQKVGSIYLYDVPPPVAKTFPISDSNNINQSSYDTPPSPRTFIENYDQPKPQMDYDVPVGDLNSVVPLQCGFVPDVSYDIPVSHEPIQSYNVCHSNRSSGVSVLSGCSSPLGSQTSLNASSQSSNRSSLETADLYDIPPPPKATMSLDPEIFYDTPPTPKPTSNFPESVYDIPPQVTRDVSPLPPAFNKTTAVDSATTRCSPSLSVVDSPESQGIEFDTKGKELLLELDSAMEILVKIHHELQSAIIKLFTFVGNAASKKPQEAFEAKNASEKLSESLGEMVQFCIGCLANSTHASDKNLYHKLKKLITPVFEANNKLKELIVTSEEKGWTTQELDLIVSLARPLVEEVRPVASFIQGNSVLLFKRSATPSKPVVPPKPKELCNNKGNAVQERPLPPTPPASKDIIKSISKEAIQPPNDYDYVNLESREVVEKENAELKAALPTKDLQESFENLLKEADIPVSCKEAKDHINLGDRQLLQFYVGQLDSHLHYLTNAIDAFLLTIEKNQPPKVFIGHSKFVILAAYKLVYIGDTVHRNLTNQELRQQASDGSNHLCDAVKILVANTKTAALQFPSVTAVQSMVDSIVDLSHIANQLKLILNRPLKSP